jgi:hypothetical protein
MFASRLLTAGLLVAAGGAAADTIYKHVDEKGNVTYSSSPPKGVGKVKKLDVPDKPSAAAVEAARRQVEEDKRRLDAYDAERRRQEAERVEPGEERAARAPSATEVAPASVVGDEVPVYYPTWGYRPPLRPVTPWPQPELPGATPPPPNLTLPPMAPPKRPTPEPE